VLVCGVLACTRALLGLVFATIVGISISYGSEEEGLTCAPRDVG
jgi:hypothetical protein